MRLVEYRLVLFFLLFTIISACKNLGNNENNDASNYRFEVHTYFDNGQIRSITPYNKNSEIDGEIQEWYSNGMISSKIQVKNNVYHGSRIVCTSLGGCLYESYVDGSLNGMYYSVSSAGDTLVVKEYENGQLVLTVVDQTGSFSK